MKETFIKNVSNELRSLRATKKYTQQYVANKANVDVMTIVRYENESCSMRLDILERIVMVYDIDLYIFFESINANIHNKIIN